MVDISKSYLLQTDDITGFDRPSSCFDSGRCQQIQSSYLSYNQYASQDSKKTEPTESSSPHTQAASSGAPGRVGSFFREGNWVELGSQGSWSGSWIVVDMLPSSKDEAEVKMEAGREVKDLQISTTRPSPS